MNEKYRQKRENIFLQYLKDNHIKATPLERYINGNTKINFQCEQGHIFSIRPRAVVDGQGCPYCSGNKVLVGFNDFNTTHPELAKYLKNQEDGFKYSFGSHKKVDWICPICKKEIKGSFHDISHIGVVCKCCSDNVSYSEKFVSSLLRQLDINYIHDKTLPWSNYKRYDFYLPVHNTIIECHGVQHYKETHISKDLISIQKNDKYKNDLALQNGIQNYIVLDCKKSELQYIKESILNSQLNDMFDLSIIDWDKCHFDTFKSIVGQILNLWEKGKNTVEIANSLEIDRHTVVKYLKRANDVNLCEYNPVEEQNKGRKKAYSMLKRPVICVETQKIYNSISEAAEFLNCAYQGIQGCCSGKRRTYKGFHWEYII